MTGFRSFHLQDADHVQPGSQYGLFFSRPTRSLGPAVTRRHSHRRGPWDAGPSTAATDDRQSAPPARR